MICEPNMKGNVDIFLKCWFIIQKKVTFCFKMNYFKRDVLSCLDLFLLYLVVIYLLIWKGWHILGFSMLFSQFLKLIRTLNYISLKIWLNRPDHHCCSLIYYAIVELFTEIQTKCQEASLWKSWPCGEIMF